MEPQDQVSLLPPLSVADPKYVTIRIPRLFLEVGWKPATHALGMLNVQILKGVYFLSDGQRVVYVGRSKDIFRRIVNHMLERRKYFSAFKYFVIADEFYRDLTEVYYINTLRPKYNITFEMKGRIR